MATELDIPLSFGSVGLAMVLDGRESVAVPSYRINEGGTVKRFRAVVVGPLLVINQTDQVMTVEVAQDDGINLLAPWLEGGGYMETQTLTIEPFKAEILSPLKTYVGLNVAGGTGVLRPVGVLTRGPSSMPYQEPQLFQMG